MSQVIGSPDWQRGVVKSEKLLATVAAGVTTATVAVPANVTRLIVAWQGYINATSVEVADATTGMTYPGMQLETSGVASNSYFYEFQVSTVLGDTVNVTINAVLATHQWYVISASDTDIVNVPALSNLVQSWNIATNQVGINALGTDGTDSRILSVDSNGRQVPLVPTAGIDKAVVAGANALLAAPASGGNYLFALDVINTSGGANTLTLSDASGNTIGKVALAAADPSFTLELQGFRVTTAVSVNAVAGADVVLRYAPGP